MRDASLGSGTTGKSLTWGQGLHDRYSPTTYRDYGFRPGSIVSGGRPGEDKCPPPLSYRYDANGNLTEDTHKALTFQYNYLNLPELISETGGSGQIELVYDASGRKLIKRGPDGDREYIFGIEYLDGKLESIAAPDCSLPQKQDNLKSEKIAKLSYSPKALPPKL